MPEFTGMASALRNMDALLPGALYQIRSLVQAALHWVKRRPPTIFHHAFACPRQAAPFATGQAAQPFSGNLFEKWVDFLGHKLFARQLFVAFRFHAVMAEQAL
jgi:hypothetical protein